MSEKCVQIISNQSNLICPYKLDLGSLETNIKNDVENDKKPLIVFARAGIYFFYLTISSKFYLLIRHSIVTSCRGCNALKKKNHF